MKMFFTPVVLIYKMPMTDTWLVVSREDFDQVLRLRNAIDIYGISQSQLEYSRQVISELANVAIGNNDTLKVHSGAKISILISPKFKDTIKDKDLFTQRKILREYLLKQASVDSKEGD